MVELFGNHLQGGIADSRGQNLARFVLVATYDPLSQKLPAQAPIATEGLQDAIRRHEALTVPQLEDAFAANEAEFKRWVQTPGNETRPIREFPGYIDRIAIDSLIERRTWME